MAANSTSVPQMEINVTGVGHTIRPAERAILVLQATSANHATPAEASAAVTVTANMLMEQIKPHCPQDDNGRTLPNAAVSHYSMTTLDTSSNTHRRETKGNDRDERPIYDTYYSARADFHIKFSDFDVLNTLATLFSGMTNIKIQRIEWKLTDATLASLKGATRKYASEDAIQKARDYAEVFAGVTEEDFPNRVRPFELKEDDYNSYKQSTRPQLHYGKAQRARMVAVDREELQFQPEDVRLEIKVHTRFAVGL